MVERTLLSWWSWKENLFVIELCRVKELIKTKYVLWAHIGHMFINVLDSMWLLKKGIYGLCDSMKLGSQDLILKK